MVADDAGHILEKRDLRDDPRAMLGVTFHDDPLGFAQRSRLAQDIVRNANLADVVEKCAAPQRRHVTGRDRKLRDDELHVLDDPA